MGTYGLPYKGSKSNIAEDIISFLPSGKRLIDLFGGGGAITHCGLTTFKWPSIVYNDYNPLTVQYFKNAILGRYSNNNFRPQWIDKETFLKLKDKDEYIKYVWSFGADGRTYLFGDTTCIFKKHAHNFIVFNDRNSLNYLKSYFKNSYYWLLSEIYHNDIETTLTYWVNIVLKLEAIKVCKDFGDTNVYNTFKRLSFKDFFNLSHKPLISAINKYCPTIPKKKYKNYCETHVLTRLEELKDLNFYQNLQQFYKIKQVQNLKSLKSDRLSVLNISYENYEYKEGDIVYCDIPYENTNKYDEEFNHKEFYDWAMSRPYRVFFSSYEISDRRFFKVFEKHRLCLMSSTKKTDTIENIYCNQNYKSLEYKFKNKKLF